MDLQTIKKLIPNSDAWTFAKSIDFGWSGEKKFYIENSKKEKMLLRLLSPEQYDNQREGILFLKDFCKVCSDVPKVYADGKTLDGKYYYLLLNYFEGENGMEAIKGYTLDEQYTLGLKMGKTIKLLHSQSQPINDVELRYKFVSHVNSYLDYYIDNRESFGFLGDIEALINDFKNSIKDRPMIMLHNDFHLGNMVIDGENIYLIDFNRASYGDYIKEFDSMAWSVRDSSMFVTGILDSYLEGEDRDYFFRLLRGYISIWQLQMLKFIENEDEEEKRVVLDLVKFTQTWFQEDSNIPNWYLENTRL